MSAKMLRMIKSVAESREKRRKKHNVKTMANMRVQDLCRLRDCKRAIEALGIRLEVPSAFVQLLINGSKEGL